MTNNYDLGIVIPAKGVSHRLKDKNFLPFGDNKSLLGWKIAQLLEIVDPKIIYVSSECDRIKAIAKEYGVNIHHRDPVLSDESVSNVSTFTTEIIKDIDHEHIAWVHLTNPLNSPAEYQKCFDSYFDNVIKNKTHDSLFTVNRIYDYIWDDKAPVNYTLGANHTYSQDLPAWYKLTCSIFMKPKETILRDRYYVGDNPFRMEGDLLSGIDINNPEDYEICQALYKLYMKKHYGK